jgi:hypothetical protein
MSDGLVLTAELIKSYKEKRYLLTNKPLFTT